MTDEVEFINTTSIHIYTFSFFFVLPTSNIGEMTGVNIMATCRSNNVKPATTPAPHDHKLCLARFTSHFITVLTNTIFLRW